MGRAYRLGHPPRGIVHPANALPEGRDGIVLQVDVTRGSDGAIAITEVSGTPLWMENDFLDHPEAPTIRAVRLAAAAPEVCAERLPIVRRALGDVVRLDATCP
jgi:hypothetical protein